MDEKNSNQKSNNEQSVDEILKQINDSIYSEDDEKPIETEGISLSAVSNLPDKQKGKRKKEHRKYGFIGWIIAIVVISGLLSAAALMTFTDLMGITFGEDNSVEITIPQGATTEQIADILHESGAVRYPLIFRLFSRLTKADGTYQYGIYVVKPSMGYEGLVDELQQISAIQADVEITIPERASISDIGAIFEKNKLCTKSEFKQAMNKGKYNMELVKQIPKEQVYYLLEGYLYADTYRFSKSDNGVQNAELAITKMLRELESKLTDEMYAQADKLGYSMHEILTMASIIELEASGSEPEMKNVSQVFYNRLSWDEPHLLGSTPTSSYPSEKYDTNKYEGLPPGPLCSPSLAAINAALYPNTELKATYFVTDKNMKFYYTNSLSEHNNIIYKLKSQGLWEY